VTLFLAVSLLLATGVLALALATEDARRRGPSLPQPLASCPETTVVLPVRDEERNVGDCLETLLAQTAPLQVRVIDDGSTDRTGSLVRERAASQPRLSLLSAGSLPPGWRGKVHALAVGSRDVSTPWLLLTDADTRHAPDLAARAHAAAAAWRLDAVSLAGVQESRGWGENLLTPAVFALLDAQLADWEAAAKGAGPPIANGQFILLRREAWESCGGFEAVRLEPIDDVAIAARLRACGYRTGFLRSRELRVRMYRGWRETLRGWRRNLGGLFGARLPRLAILLSVLLLPPLALLAALAAGRSVEAALLWSAGAAASILLRTGSRHAGLYGLLYPLDSLLLAWVLGLSAIDRRRGKLASWKGREMPV
jgi:cellulose synthase/poly-beta-1,6-N-acetylglucosamine synthase-like glycosyltransferase